MTTSSADGSRGRESYSRDNVRREYRNTDDRGRERGGIERENGEYKDRQNRSYSGEGRQSRNYRGSGEDRQNRTYSGNGENRQNRTYSGSGENRQGRTYSGDRQNRSYGGGENRQIRSYGSDNGEGRQSRPYNSQNRGYNRGYTPDKDKDEEQPRRRSEPRKVQDKDARYKEQQPDKLEIISRLEKEKKAMQRKEEEKRKNAKSARAVARPKRSNNIDWTREYENGSYDDDDMDVYLSQ